MIQQINLYQDILKQDQAKPVINSTLLGLLAFILLIIAFSLYLVLDLNNTKKSLELAKQQLSKAETRVQLIQVQYPKQQLNSLLTEEVSRSQTMLASLSRIIEKLTDENSDQTQGFSRYFSALARQSMADIWLTNIIINAHKHSLLIQGSTYNPEKVAVFLQKLHHESVFRGKIFAKLIMSKAEEIDHQINFAVSTTSEMLEPKTHE